MTCKEFEKLTPDFIGHKMDFLTLKEFNEHMKSCSECYEELVIQFLVTEGMSRLEDGDVFDLQMEMKERLAEAEKSVRFHSLFLYIGAGLEVVAIGLIAAAVIWLIV